MPNCGFDLSGYANQWCGTSMICEIAICEYEELREIEVLEQEIIMEELPQPKQERHKSINPKFFRIMDLNYVIDIFGFLIPINTAITNIELSAVIRQYSNHEQATMCADYLENYDDMIIKHVYNGYICTIKSSNYE